MPWPNDILACSTGRQDLYGRTRPATAPGKPKRGAWPKPDLVNISHISCDGIASAIFDTPMFDDFWMMVDTSIMPCGWVSRIVRSPTTKRPLVVVSNIVV